MRRIAGYLGATAALGCVGWLAYQGWGDLPSVDLRSGVAWRNLGLGLGLYLTCQLLAAVAWRYTLKALAQDGDCGLAESEMMVSQIGKYIPGNFAHLLGRLSLARADGIAGWAASLAMFLEIAMLIAVGILYIAVLMIAMPDFMADIAQHLQTQTALIYAVAAVLLGFIAAAVAFMIFNRSSHERAKSGKIEPARLLGPVLIHMINNLLLGASLYFVGIAVLPDAALSIEGCTIVFVTAWVTGFITPGAPGGIGVRDGIIALGLGLTVGGTAAVGIALMHRAISLVGDVLSFGAGLGLRRYFSQKTESNAL